MTHIVGGVDLGFAPVMIGAGVCKTPAKTSDCIKVAPVVSGSYTSKAREGNTGKLFYPETLEELEQIGFGLNAFGMPNRGFGSVSTEFSGRQFENPLIVSIAGFSPNEYLEGVRIFSTLANVAAIELNAGCPNTGHGEILSFDENVLTTLLENLSSSSIEKPLWLKFSPFTNPNELERRAKLVNQYKKLVKAVVTCNTFPNGYAGPSAIDTIRTGNYGGLSGPALKHIALGQVHQFRKYLDPDIDVIGVGGIMTGNDIVDFLDAGAKAVQLTSMPFWLGEPSKFLDILTSGPDCSLFVDKIQYR